MVDGKIKKVLVDEHSINILIMGTITSISEQYKSITTTDTIHINEVESVRKGNYKNILNINILI